MLGSESYQSLEPADEGDASRRARILRSHPLSLFVTQVADKITTDISNLPSPESIADVHRWGRAFQQLTDARHRPDANRLIIVVVLQLAASWDFRFMGLTVRLPLLLLFMLVSPCGEADAKRCQVAAFVLDAPDCCLRRSRGDVAIKLKQMFAAGLQSVVDSGGKRPVILFVFLLAYRASLPFDTQCIEGINSILVEMARRAPLMKIPLASDRLQIKQGDPITPEECCGFHTDALAELGESSHTERFLPVVETATQPTVIF